MKTFWKTHPALRIVLMIVLFVLSIALVVAGWKMTGQLAGLGIMLVGVALLLAVLAIYLSLIHISHSSVMSFAPQARLFFSAVCMVEPAVER